MENFYMTAVEVSKMLRISKSKIYKMTMNDQIPYFKVGGKLLFKKDAVIDFVEGRSPIKSIKGPDGFDLLSPFSISA